MAAIEAILGRWLNLLRVLRIMFQTSSLSQQYVESYKTYLASLISN